MTIYKNINDNKFYMIEHIIISDCVCGKCGIGYFAYGLWSAWRKYNQKIEIQESDIGSVYIPVSEI